MISFISSWASTIIFAVIIGIVLKMLIPEGKNKKYIKVVIGIYILFAVISPVVGKSIDIDLSKYNLNMEQSIDNVEASTDKNINEIYITNLKQDIVAKLNKKSYGCEKVELKTNDNYEIESIKISGIYELKEETVEEVNKIVINEIQINTEDIKDKVVKGIPTSEEKKIKQYLSETYDVNENNISIE